MVTSQFGNSVVADMSAQPRSLGHSDELPHLMVLDSPVSSVEGDSLLANESVDDIMLAQIIIRLLDYDLEANMMLERVTGSSRGIITWGLDRISRLMYCYRLRA